VDWGVVIAAAVTAILSSSVIGAIIAYFANRGEKRANAAATNVKTAMGLLDEAEQSRLAAIDERIEAVQARDDAARQLKDTLTRLDYVGEQDIITLRKELHDAMKRIDALEDTVKILKNELSLSKAREKQLRNKINKIKGELDTGPLHEQ
jgi:predicted unusual protein kinase regulating ubiquinone biosynthesis (AarF/ABC1/UbiB family)